MIDTLNIRNFKSLKNYENVFLNFTIQVSNNSNILSAHVQGVPDDNDYSKINYYVSCSGDRTLVVIHSISYQ